MHRKRYVAAILLFSLGKHCCHFFKQIADALCTNRITDCLSDLYRLINRLLFDKYFHVLFQRLVVDAFKRQFAKKNCHTPPAKPGA